MLKPVNGHLLIEPVPYEGFMAQARETYQEIGVVLSVADDLAGEPCEVGCRVFFDSWLSAKFPKSGGGADDFLWLIKWEDVRAIEKPDAQP